MRFCLNDPPGGPCTRTSRALASSPAVTAARWLALNCWSRVACTAGGTARRFLPADAAGGCGGR